MKSALGRRLGRAALAAALIALGAALASWIVVEADVAPSLRADATSSLQPSGSVARDIVVVALDERFMRRAQVVATGTYASLAAALRDLRAHAIVILPEVAQAAGRAFGDQYFTEQATLLLRTLGNVVLGLPPVALDAPRAGSPLPLVRDPLAVSATADAAARTGLDTSPHTNGRTIAVAGEVPTGGRLSARTTTVVPSVALAAWIDANGMNPTLRVGDDALEVAGRRVPIEDHGQLRIRYVAPLLPDGDHVIPVLEIVDGRVPVSKLRGKTVVVGVTDPGSARFVNAPVAGGRLASTFVHANALNTLFTGKFLLAASTSSTALTAGVLAFIVVLGALLLPLWLCWLAPVVAGLVTWLLARNRFAAGTVVDVGLLLSVVVLCFVAAAGRRAWAEYRQRRHVSSVFARYVPPDIARELVDQDRAPALEEGQRVRVTVLFCDIRGFTSLTGALTPSQVRALLDCYYDTLSRIILDQGGTVLGYVGDEVYAVFGAPVESARHETAAVRCARAMHAANVRLNVRLRDAGLPPLEYGIGIHTGEVISTVVGSDVRRQYAVIGNSLNLGSRLCAQAAAGEIVISDVTFDAIGEPADDWERYTTTLKGIDGTPAVYRLTANPQSPPAVDTTLHT